MTGRHGPLVRRAGPLFGAGLVVLGAVAALSPAVPSARALDPTPEPSASGSLLASPEPSASGSLLASPEPSASAVSSPAPALTPSPAPTPDPSPFPSLDPSPAATSEPSPSPVPSIGLRTTHTWIDTLSASGRVVETGDVDGGLDGMFQGGTYRVWFQVVNGTDIGIDIGPLLVAAPGAGGGEFAAIAAPRAIAGEPFYVTPADSAKRVAVSDPVSIRDLRLQASMDPAATPVPGIVTFGQNPTTALALPAHSYTEVGFTIAVTADAAWGSPYSFRLTDGGIELSAGVTATGSLTDDPPAGPSALQLEGMDVGGPVTEFPLLAPLAGPLAGPVTSPHFDLTLTSDTCAVCHKTHTAQRAFLGAEPAPISNVCFTCHNGTTLPGSNVEGQYTASPTPPPNNTATGEYYSHPATTLGPGHTSDREDEFSNRTNRHAECADCHQPHNTDTLPGVQGVNGWTASGAVKGASGVSVVNGAAGSAPTYTWRKTTSLEYELCFKCHSGFTTLNNTGARDKGIELNPANTSFHPVEAAGKNATTGMADNLAGTSPYKLWNFTVGSTVRCTHCHGNPRTREPTGTPAPDANLSPHTSQYEGILIAQYRRTVHAPGEAYVASEVALCYLCHAEAGTTPTDPFDNKHATHVTGHTKSGSQLCFECHYQIHSTTPAPAGQTVDGSRLVVFAPNVTPYTPRNGSPELSWTRDPQGGGTCTLVCHGKDHPQLKY